jgi:hypothetical protein
VIWVGDEGGLLAEYERLVAPAFSPT